MGHFFEEPRLREAAEETLEKLRQDGAAASPKLRKALDYLSKNIFDSSLSVATLSRECGVAASYLSHRFQTELGTSPGAYVAQRRCETAQHLLANGELGLARIAALVGFPSLPAFRRAFQRHLGVSPGDARAEARPGSTPEERLVALRRCLLGHEGPAAVAAIADAAELVHRQRSPTTSAMELGGKGGEARLEARALELLRPHILAWRQDERYALARKGFRPKTPAFFRRLLRLSREEGRDDRARGLRWAELAVESLWPLRRALPARKLAHLRAEAYARLGNARRLTFDYAGAERAFAVAEAELAKHPAPAELSAEVFWLKGTLRQFQRRLSEARQLLDEALTKAAEPAMRARILLTRGIVYELQGAERAAESDYTEAQRQLDAGTDAYLRISAHLCLGVLLARRGHHRRAEAELEAARRRAPAGGSLRVDAHVGWVEGLVRHARGQQERAERCLRETRESFCALDDPVFVALVGLDLALLLCEKGRMAEVETLMAEALPLFERLHFDAEGQAALKLLQRAAARRQVTAVLLGRLRTHLEKLGMAPRRP